MPKTVFQDVVFTLIMVIIMVYGMVFYNVCLAMGAVTNAAFLEALKELPLTGLIAFVLEFVLVGRLMKFIAFRTIDPSKTQPFFITLLISCLTIAFMCPLMSFIESLIHNYNGAENIIVNWLKTMGFNFPMAIVWQLFYCGPLVRLIFRTIFKKQLKKDAEKEDRKKQITNKL